MVVGVEGASQLSPRPVLGFWVPACLARLDEMSKPPGDFCFSLRFDEGRPLGPARPGQSVGRWVRQPAPWDGSAVGTDPFAHFVLHSELAQGCS